MVACIVRKSFADAWRVVRACGGSIGGSGNCPAVRIPTLRIWDTAAGPHCWHSFGCGHKGSGARVAPKSVAGERQRLWRILRMRATVSLRCLAQETLAIKNRCQSLLPKSRLRGEFIPVQAVLGVGVGRHTEPGLSPSVSRGEGRAWRRRAVRPGTRASASRQSRRPWPFRAGYF